MARLLGTMSPVVLAVGPEWVELDHHGLISDRTLPGSITPCPFLTDNSVVRVIQTPRWVGGPDSLERPLRISLTFPDGELRDQQYTLPRHVTVPQFKGYLATLMGTTSPLVLSASPDWEELGHLGPVSARVFPRSSITCPYLYQGSTVRVRRGSSLGPINETDESPSTNSPHGECPQKRLRDSSRVGGAEPVAVGMTGESSQSSSSDGLDLDGEIRVTQSEHRKLRTEFRKEAKLA
jgi:hypothetical protein